MPSTAIGSAACCASPSPGSGPAIEAFDVILRLKRGCARREVPAVAAEATTLLAALVAASGECPAR